MTKQFGVAVKAIIMREDKFLILKKSSKEDINPNTYDIPGGRLEFGETPEDALKREVKEETGLDINVIKPTRMWTFMKEDLQVIGITFLCIAKQDSVKLSFEHDYALWLMQDEIFEKEDLPSWILDEIKSIKN